MLPWDNTEYALTRSESKRYWTAKFMQKQDILDAVKGWVNESGRGILRLKNVVCDNSIGPIAKQEAVYMMSTDMDKFASDMMEISLSYAILEVNNLGLKGMWEIAVSKTAHNTTNIDADVIYAIITATREKKDEVEDE